MPVRLRIATFVTLVVSPVFLPLPAIYAGDRALPILLALYGVHAALTSAILIASYTPLGQRCADRLALLLVIGHAMNLEACLYVWPADPGVAGGVLTCLLVGSGLLFSWSARRMLVLSGFFCLTFLGVKAAVRPDEFHHLPFTMAAVTLLVGAAIAVASAR